MNLFQCESLSQVEKAKIKQMRKGMSVVLAVYLCLNSVVALKLVRGVTGLIFSGLVGLFFFASVALGIGLVIRARDEFRRTLLLKSLYWATGITMGLVSIWGYMEIFSPVALPRVPLLAVPMVLILVMTVVKVLIFRQHRVMREEPAA